jgi:hypothetical protein
MIDAAFLRSLGWTDELIEAAQKVVEEAAPAVIPRSDVEMYDASGYSVETTTRIDLTMTPEMSAWPRLSQD